MKSTTANILRVAELLAGRYRFFIFDLDGTLYDEKLYLYAAYRKIAEGMAARYPLSSSELEKFMVDSFEMEGRFNLFDKVCSRFNIAESDISEMLEILRTVKILTPIELYEDSSNLVKALIEKGKMVFVVTNGNLQQQQNKIQSINWHGLDKQIQFTFCAQFKPKPDRATFDYLVDKFKVVASETVSIGDTAGDAEFAERSGIDFIDIRNLPTYGL
jgi:putative hydrolase of the HAD superfamily